MLEAESLYTRLMCSVIECPQGDAYTPAFGLGNGVAHSMPLNAEAHEYTPHTMLCAEIAILNQLRADGYIPNEMIDMDAREDDDLSTHLRRCKKLLSEQVLGVLENSAWHTEVGRLAAVGRQLVALGRENGDGCRRLAGFCERLCLSFPPAYLCFVMPSSSQVFVTTFLNPGRFVCVCVCACVRACVCVSAQLDVCIQYTHTYISCLSCD